MAKRTYTRNDYRAYADDKHLDFFYEYVSELENFVAEEGWALKKYFNTYWCSFKSKHHGEAAFGIALKSRNVIYLYVKRVRNEVNAFPIRVWRYQESYDQAEYLLEPRKTQLKSFRSLLQLGYTRNRDCSLLDSSPDSSQLLKG